MKAYIDRDEWWPVYSLHRPDARNRWLGDEVDVEPALLRRWERAEATFDDLQKELDELWDATQRRLAKP